MIVFNSKYILRSFIVLALTFMFKTGQAQDGVNAKEIEQTVLDMMHTYETLPETKNKEKMLEYFDKNYKVDRVRFNISERFEYKINNLEDADRLFTLVTQNPGMKVEYKVDRFIKTYASETLGYAIFEATYNITKDDNPYVHGTEIQTYFFQKFEGRWKVMHGQVVQVRDKVNKSACSCQVYKSEASSNSFIVQTEVPDGDVFVKKMNTFTFETLENGFRVVDVDGKRFSWDTDGKLQALPSGIGQSNQELGPEFGKAMKPIEVVTTILMEVLYSNNCSAINVKK
jgi:hypothetical protein